MFVPGLLVADDNREDRNNPVRQINPDLAEARRLRNNLVKNYFM